MSTQDSFHSLLFELRKERRSAEEIDKFKSRWWLSGNIACPHCLLDRRSEQPLFKITGTEGSSYALVCPSCRRRFAVNVD